VPKSGTARYKPFSRDKLSMRSVVCLKRSPKRPCRVRQVWTAASLYCHWHTRLPVGGGAQITTGSNRIDNDQLYIRPSLQDDQFIIGLCSIAAQLLMVLSYHAGVRQ
jgi:hypothetical protein